MVERQTIENSAASVKFQILIQRVVTAIPATTGFLDDGAHQVRDILVRKRIDQHGVNHAEHRRRGANAQSERSSRHERKPGVVPKIANSKTKIAYETA